MFELVIGNRHSGKTTYVINKTLRNKKENRDIIIYTIDKNKYINESYYYSVSRFKDVCYNYYNFILNKKIKILDKFDNNYEKKHNLYEIYDKYIKEFKNKIIIVDDADFYKNTGYFRYLSLFEHRGKYDLYLTIQSFKSVNSMVRANTNNIIFMIDLIPYNYYKLSYEEQIKINKKINYHLLGYN